MLRVACDILGAVELNQRRAQCCCCCCWRSAASGRPAAETETAESNGRSRPHLQRPPPSMQRSSNAALRPGMTAFRSPALLPQPAAPDKRGTVERAATWCLGFRGG
eukprot:GHVU01212219.1.p1 GENE.GHVU01212219.1~~GHVU01212219.1.p1  ORF type:complete len:106 (-),score=14.19 GHVU01212219.1:121-438(-)